MQTTVTLFSNPLLVPHDQIDYESLTNVVLCHLARQSSDEFISTSALAELGIREAADAPGLAREIAMNPAFDVHSRAHALGVLFSNAPLIANEVVSALIAANRMERKLLEAAMDGFLCNKQLYETEDSRVLPIRLARIVRNNPLSIYSDQDEVAAFLAWLNAKQS